MSKILVGLQSSQYVHEVDNAYLQKLKAIPLLTKLTAKGLGVQLQWDLVSLRGSNLQITNGSLPDLYKVAKTAIETLDLPTMPDIYLDPTFELNAYTMGNNQTDMIVIYAGAVDRLTPEELQFVIGHEAGHIKSGHVLYHYMANIIGTLMPDAVKTVLFYTLQHWNRMSEFTADRAGLLACQDIDVAIKALMKMGGLPNRFYESAKVEGFIDQARAFKNANSLESIIQNLENLKQDHPWTVIRAAELLSFYESGEYEKIINGCQTKICPGCKKALATNTKCCPICGYKWD